MFTGRDSFFSTGYISQFSKYFFTNYIYIRRSMPQLKQIKNGGSNMSPFAENISKEKLSCIYMHRIFQRKLSHCCHLRRITGELRNRWETFHIHTLSCFLNFESCEFTAASKKEQNAKVKRLNIYIFIPHYFLQRL